LTQLIILKQHNLESTPAMLHNGTFGHIALFQKKKKKKKDLNLNGNSNAQLQNVQSSLLET
jgi:hypothetical protein